MKMYYYACYGYTDDATADEDNPSWRVPYVSSFSTWTHDPSIDFPPDTWPDSGPFETYGEAWDRAKEIAAREFRTSWESPTNGQLKATVESLKKLLADCEARVAYFMKDSDGVLICDDDGDPMLEYNLQNAINGAQYMVHDGEYYDEIRIYKHGKTVPEHVVTRSPEKTHTFAPGQRIKANRDITYRMFTTQVGEDEAMIYAQKDDLATLVGEGGRELDLHVLFDADISSYLMKSEWFDAVEDKQ